MKRSSKIIAFLILFIISIATLGTESFAAELGQQLTSPEEGWQRINDSDKNIIYENFTKPHFSYQPSYNHDISATTSANGKIYFKFKGTKLRLITEQSTVRATSHTITIDGTIIESYTELAEAHKDIILSYEKIGLTDTVHTVVITSGTDGTYPITLDAIDIDETGYMVDYNAPANLVATPGNAVVDLSWNAVEGATGYTIKRSLTQGGPYEVIGTSPSNTYKDTDVTNGTTYYYVVSAIVGGVESTNTNEDSATPTAPEVVGNNAILEITMTNGQIKEYDMTEMEIQAFLTWYDNRESGTSKAYYIITKKYNIKPFLTRNEYISYDEISSFEVKAYTN